jgi:hypothetical protein
MVDPTAKKPPFRNNNHRGFSYARWLDRQRGGTCPERACVEGEPSLDARVNQGGEAYGSRSTQDAGQHQGSDGGPAKSGLYESIRTAVAGRDAGWESEPPRTWSNLPPSVTPTADGGAIIGYFDQPPPHPIDPLEAYRQIESVCMVCGKHYCGDHCCGQPLSPIAKQAEAKTVRIYCPRRAFWGTVALVAISMSIIGLALAAVWLTKGSVG